MEVTPLELQQKLKNGENLILLDVRDPEERAFCHIGGLHIPMGEITSRLHELDDETEMVIYCHHGMRSAQVAAYLMQQGFAKVYNLKGGIDRWACEVDAKVARY